MLYIYLKYKGIQIKVWPILSRTFEKPWWKIWKPELGFNNGLNLYREGEKVDISYVCFLWFWVFLTPFILCDHFYLGFFSITTSFFFFSFFFFLTFVLELGSILSLLDIKNYVYINDSLIYISNSSLELQIHVPCHLCIPQSTSNWTDLQ